MVILLGLISFSLPFYGNITGPNNLYFSFPFYGNITRPNNLYFNLPFYGNIARPNNLCFSFPFYGNIAGPNNLRFSLPMCSNIKLIKDNRLHTQPLLLCPTNAVLSYVLGYASIYNVLLMCWF